MARSLHMARSPWLARSPQMAQKESTLPTKVARIPQMARCLQMYNPLRLARSPLRWQKGSSHMAIEVHINGKKFT